MLLEGRKKEARRYLQNIQKADDAAFLLKSCGGVQSFNRTEIEHGNDRRQDLSRPFPAERKTILMGSFDSPFAFSCASVLPTFWY